MKKIENGTLEEQVKASAKFSAFERMIESANRLLPIKLTYTMDIKSANEFEYTFFCNEKEVIKTTEEIFNNYDEYWFYGFYVFTAQVECCLDTIYGELMIPHFSFKSM